MNKEEGQGQPTQGCQDSADANDGLDGNELTGVVIPVVQTLGGKDGSSVQERIFPGHFQTNVQC